MARINSRALYSLLLLALRKGPLLERLLYNFGVEPLFAASFPTRSSIRNLEGFGDRDVRDMAEYLAAAFNLMDPEVQEGVLARISETMSEIPWPEGFGPRDLISFEPANWFVEPEPDTGSDFDRSAGPDLVPTVTMDKFKDLLDQVPYSSFQDRTSLEDEVLTDVAENADQRRMTYWSMLLFMELRKRTTEIAHHVTGFWQSAVGFLNPVTEGNDFGVIVLALSGDRSESRFLPPIELEGKSCPCVVRQITLAEQAFPSTHPTNGTVACWARSRRSTSTSRLGVLTAKHVVGTRIGHRVKFSGGVGRVIDVAPAGIDAALVDTTEAFDRRSKPMKAISAIAPWTNVQFTGAMSGPHVTKVTATTDQLGILNSPLFPVRVLLGKYGRGGDSGALILEGPRSRTARAVGLYLAKYTDSAGRSGGLAQHMGQAVEIMDMELYR